MPNAAQHYLYNDPGSNSVPVDWIAITPGATLFTKPLRYIRANTAGTVTVTTPGGSRVMNFLAGETRAGMFLAVTAAAATGLEGGI